MAYAVSISLCPMQFGVELGHVTTRVLCCRVVDCRIVAMFKTFVFLGASGLAMKLKLNMLGS